MFQRTGNDVSFLRSSKSPASHVCFKKMRHNSSKSGAEFWRAAGFQHTFCLEKECLLFLEIQVLSKAVAGDSSIESSSWKVENVTVSDGAFREYIRGYRVKLQGHPGRCFILERITGNIQPRHHILQILCKTAAIPSQTLRNFR